MIRYDHYIDGADVAPSSGEFLPTENPYTGQAWAEIARGNRADAEAAVAAAQRAFSSGAWPALTASERGGIDRTAMEKSLARLNARSPGAAQADASPPPVR